MIIDQINTNTCRKIYFYLFIVDDVDTKQLLLNSTNNNTHIEGLVPDM